MSDRPVHAGTLLLVGAVGCRRQGRLGWAKVLEAWAWDRFPKNKQESLLAITFTTSHHQHWHPSTLNAGQPHLSGNRISVWFSEVFNYSCNERVQMEIFGWEQLGVETASSTLGWRERQIRSVSGWVSSHISLHVSLSDSHYYTDSSHFLKFFLSAWLSTICFKFPPATISILTYSRTVLPTHNNRQQETRGGQSQSSRDQLCLFSNLPTPLMITCIRPAQSIRRWKRFFHDLRNRPCTRYMVWKVQS